MKQSTILLAAIAVIFSPAAFANPVCIDPASDSDGDGWGWENDASCVVAAEAACIDTDGDGWGWDGTNSCLIETVTTECIDTDGDGFGWDGSATCLVDTNTDNIVLEDPPELTEPVCVDSEPLNDTWGWNGTNTCRTAPQLPPQDTSAIAGLYDIAGDEQEIVYLNIEDDGFFTIYDNQTFAGDCFLLVDFNNSPEESGIQIRPLGGNSYEFYSYDLYDGYLEEDTQLNEIFVDSDNSLNISFEDYYYDEFGNEVNESITDVLPAVSGVDVSELDICEVDDPFQVNSGRTGGSGNSGGGSTVSDPITTEDPDLTTVTVEFEIPQRINEPDQVTIYMLVEDAPRPITTQGRAVQTSVVVINQTIVDIDVLLVHDYTGDSVVVAQATLQVDSGDQDLTVTLDDNQFDFSFDYDADGVLNIDEVQAGTDPFNPN